MKNIMLLTAILLCSFLSACNTKEGLGQDIQKGGQAIEKAASK